VAASRRRPSSSSLASSLASFFADARNACDDAAGGAEEDHLTRVAQPGRSRPTFYRDFLPAARQQPPTSGHAHRSEGAPSGTARLASDQGVGGAPLIRNGTVTMLDATPRSSFRIRVIGAASLTSRYAPGYARDGLFRLLRHT
jgi:hypothetical protein